MHLGVKLHRKNLAAHVSRDCKRRVGRRAKDLKPGGDGADMVSMAHPDLF